ncbi:MAG: hypothetical protein COX77_01315 [Candidatus Komeilibacteria bacterium CG_4_10_14_0_2_um_filter_37_10]|uniref:RNA polymerase sigma factor n=1 Tax=Candidatus Komeilibacteria bacterium CG_4_10_14_0_2_um_filter_37_10 TaxID=1974470 RepID=A0A2M7VGB0_9BACT|nr:MAG: hypothetical protein COX77_01315 [Candidatus Komeilibacteria bacterium CG_4_10_14_0_2_um_filter_37_10]PJA92644.1 MAG: hypothetical protein CO133_02080 [Candidatus Komeilibacteria bacterium CG_4_9_14_3_um_filter_37_5]
MINTVDFTQLPDQEIVQKVLANPDYYMIIMDRYENKLTAYIRRISGLSPEDIEDVLQETFLQAYRSLNDYDESYKFSTWIYHLAHNKTIDFWRKHKKHLSNLELDEQKDFVALLRDDTNAAEKMDQLIDRHKVMRALENISLEQREALILRYWEDKSYEEMSDILHKPIGTVGVLISRAKKELKKHIANI